MAKKRFEFIIAASSTGYQSVNKMRTGIAAFNKEVGNGNQLMATAKAQVSALVGAYLGFNALTGTAGIIKDADAAAFALQSSLQAANREFDNVGSLDSWGSTLAEVSEQLKIYSQGELKTAAARTIDMTKRLGLSAEQMKTLIIRTGDLSAGKFDLENGIERVTAALRGEAEASEALGLTLNETYVKSWYEAQGAMQGAWKDLDDLQKAQVRYQVFLEQAAPFAGKAAKSLETLGGAYAHVKAKIADAITESQEMKDVAADLAKYISENADEIGDMAASIARWAAETAKWVVDNRELIVAVGKWGGLLLVTAKVVGVLAAGIRGLNAAALAMTGTNLLGWLSKLRGAVVAVAAALGPVGALVAAAIASVAYGISGIIKMISNYRELKQIQKDTADIAAVVARNEGEIAQKLKEVSDATGVTVTSMDELNQAAKDGKIHFDDLTGTWKKGAGEMSAAVEQSAATQSAVTGAKLDEMKAAYKSYADEVKKLQDQIAGREQSLAEQLRELSRSGMSELGAWRDRKKEAEEYYQAAQRAAKAGDYEGAVKLADKAKEAYADLNTEVKDGEKVQISQATALKNAMSGVEKAGKLGIDILKKQEEAAKKAGEALNKETGGQLAAQMPEVAKAFGKVSDQAVALAEKAKSTEQAWNYTFTTMEKDGKSAISELERKFRLLERDRHVNVYIKEIRQRALGGLAGTGSVPGFAGGGSPMYFPRPSSPLIRTGSSKKDDVPAMLSWREFIQPESSVDYYGVDFMERIRRRLFPRALAQRFATGGTPAGPVSLRPSSSGAAAAVAGDTFNITVNAGNGTDGRSIARQVMDEIERARRRRS